jgi:signal peptidase I
MNALTNWGIFSVVSLAVLLVAAPTSLGGPASYVIVDGSSMEPTYDDGDLVVAFERQTYRPGDVIVYEAPIDVTFNVIHRIVEPTAGGYVTQGDNRDEPDGWIAPHDTIHGAARLHIPNGGALLLFLRQPAVILGLVAGLGAFEVLKRREQRPAVAIDVDDAETTSEPVAETGR